MKYAIAALALLAAQAHAGWLGFGSWPADSLEIAETINSCWEADQGDTVSNWLDTGAVSILEREGFFRLGQDASSSKVNGFKA